MAWFKRFWLCCLGLSAALTCSPVWADDTPAVTLASAPLVTPTNASTYYGSSTTHTEGSVAWSESGSPVAAPEIRAQAIALGSGRLAASEITQSEYIQNVFGYVRNNIAVEFRYGLGKGARGALIDQSGTPFDQAELMVKLLREGGVTANFQIGTITLNASEFGVWTGLITSLNEGAQTFTVDAHAACQFLADGGIPATVTVSSTTYTSCGSVTGNLTSVTLSHVWVSAGGNLYDPAYKRHTLHNGIDLPSAMGCGTRSSPTCGSTVATAGGGTTGTLSGAATITGIDESAIASQLQTYAASLQTYIESNVPDAPIEEIAGGKTLDVTFAPTVSSSLPYSGGASAATTWTGNVPNQYRTQFTIGQASGTLTLYADELAGRRVELRGPDLSASVLQGPVLQIDNGTVGSTPELPDSGTIVLGVLHPYAANSGAYADQTNTFAFAAPGLGHYGALILQVGNGTPSASVYRSTTNTVQFRRGVDTEHPDNSTAASTNGAQLLAQITTANQLIAGVTRADVNVQHIVGVSGAGIDSTTANRGFSIATLVSVNSNASVSADRTTAFELVANLDAMLEGSVLEQTQGSWPANSTAANFHFANGAGAKFVLLTPSTYSGAVGSIPIPNSTISTWLGDLHSASQSLIALDTTSGTISITGGTFHASWPAYFAFGATDNIAHIVGEYAKGGGAPQAADPAVAATNTITQSPASLRARGQAEANLANGSLTFSPPPDLVTGAGSFPFALPFQRTYNSSTAFQEDYPDGVDVNNNPIYFYALPYEYSGAGTGAIPRIGGGWSHNFQISANLGSDGLLAMGSERGLHAASFLAGLTVLQNQLTSPTFQGRLSAFMVDFWISQRFIDNRANVTIEPQTVTFARLPSGFAPGMGRQERLTQTNARLGPLVVDHQDPTGFDLPGFSYSSVSFAFTDATGATIAFSQLARRVTNSNVSGGSVYFPLWFPASWSFPSGVRLAFSYTEENANSTVPPGGNQNYPSATGTFYTQRMTSVANNLGRSLTFSASNQRLTAVTDEHSRQVTFGYTCAHSERWSCDTVTVTGVDSGVSKYGYAADSNSPDPAYQVRANYRLRRIYTPSDGSTPFLTLRYDGFYRLSRITDPLSHATRVYSTNAGGEAWTYGASVNPLGDDTITTFNQWGGPLIVTNPLGYSTVNAYDSQHRLVLTTMPEGNQVARTYDVRSNVLTETQIPKSGALDHNGSALANIATSTTYGEGATVRACSNLVTCNLPASIIDRRGNSTSYAWNSTTGFLTSITGPAVASPTDGGSSVSPLMSLSYTGYTIGGYTTYFLTSRSDRISSSVSLTTNYTYNSSNYYNLATTSIDPSGLNLTTSFTFDTVGNLTQVNGPRTDVTDVTDYGWDSARRLTFAASPSSTSTRPVTRNTYNADGQVTQIDRGTGTGATSTGFTALERTGYQYDQVGNGARTTVFDGVTTTPLFVAQTSYDAADRQLCIAVRMNPAVFGSLPSDACTLATTGSAGADRITRTTYDAAGHVSALTRAYGTSLAQTYATTTYTANGRPEIQTDANGNSSTLVYDGFDRISRLRFPSTTLGAGTSSTTDYEAFDYDANGNRTWWRRRDGSQLAFGYDELNRDTVKDIPGGTAADVYSGYDLMGHRLFARFASASGSGIDWTYDVVGRLTGESFGGRALAYQYDSAGSRTRVTWPDGFYAGYVYDPANRISAINENGATSGVGLLASYSYDGLGRRIGITRGNGASTSFAYDTAGRLNQLVQNPTSTPYDLTLDFTRNAASQILQRQLSNDSYAFQPTPGSISYTTNGLNQYSQVSSTTYGYADGRGNLTSDGARTFTYDVENRLLSASGPTAITLTYDPNGRLGNTSVTSTSVTTTFLQAGDQVAGEYSGSTLVRRYVSEPGSGDVLVWYEGSGTTDRRWLLSDNQSSTIAYSDASGTVQNLYKYSPYGAPSAWSGSRFLFTAQVSFPEVALFYYRARIYDPILGRFLQADPTGYTDDMNLYQYVSSDPSNLLDPFGTERVCNRYGCYEVADQATRTAQSNFRNEVRQSERVVRQQLLNGAGMIILTGVTGGTAAVPGVLTRVGIGSVTGAVVNGTASALAGNSRDQVLADTARGAVSGALTAGTGSAGTALTAGAPAVVTRGAQAIGEGAAAYTSTRATGGTEFQARISAATSAVFGFFAGPSAGVTGAQVGGQIAAAIERKAATAAARGEAQDVCQRNNSNDRC